MPVVSDLNMKVEFDSKTIVIKNMQQGYKAIPNGTCEEDGGCLYKSNALHAEEAWFDGKDNG